MGLISKVFTTGCALTGLACASQLPEFTQQYRQRLAGAIEELRIVVADFDKDAAASSLTREQALEHMLGASQQFPNDRGRSMIRAIDRFDDLQAQKVSMEQVEQVSRPIFLLSSPDAKLLGGTWEIFEPAIPLNMPGLVWGGIGALMFGLFGRIPIAMARGAGRLRKRRQKDPAVSAPKVFGGQAGHVAPTHEQYAGKSDSLLNENFERVSAQTISAIPEAYSDQSPGRQSGIKTADQAEPGSLLDGIAFKEQVVGELDEHGRIVAKKHGKG